VDHHALKIVVSIQDEEHAMFFAMTHNPNHCTWCDALATRVAEHMATEEARIGP
jgi:hypothetical protein